MSERIYFLGVKFRSKSHLRWFGVSMYGLFIAIFQLTLAYATGIDNIKKTAVFYLDFCIVYSAFVSLLAVFATKFGKINGSGFSVDCIWFNALMAGIYIAMRYLFFF